EHPPVIPPIPVRVFARGVRRSAPISTVVTPKRICRNLAPSVDRGRGRLYTFRLSTAGGRPAACAHHRGEWCGGDWTGGSRANAYSAGRQARGDDGNLVPASGTAGPHLRGRHPHGDLDADPDLLDHQPEHHVQGRDGERPGSSLPAAAHPHHLPARL